MRVPEWLKGQRTVEKWEDALSDNIKSWVRIPPRTL